MLSSVTTLIQSQSIHAKMSTGDIAVLKVFIQEYDSILQSHKKRYQHLTQDHYILLQGFEAICQTLEIKIEYLEHHFNNYFLMSRLIRQSIRRKLHVQDKIVKNFIPEIPQTTEMDLLHETIQLEIEQWKINVQIFKGFLNRIKVSYIQTYFIINANSAKPPEPPSSIYGVFLILSLWFYHGCCCQIELLANAKVMSFAAIYSTT